MKKIKTIIAPLIFLLVVGMSLGADSGGGTLIREITPTSVEPGGLFTVRITATKGTDDMAGIIKELKPSSFTFYDSANWISTFDSKVEDSYGDNLDIAFTESSATGYYEYNLKAGSTSGYLNGNVEWGGGGADSLGNVCLKVNNVDCNGGGDNGGGDNGGDTDDSDNSLYLYIGIGVVALFVLPKLFS